MGKKAPKFHWEWGRILAPENTNKNPWPPYLEPYYQDFSLIKSALQKNNFLISQPKHMLWVLKRTVSMRRFCWAPKTYAKKYG